MSVVSGSSKKKPSRRESGAGSSTRDSKQVFALPRRLSSSVRKCCASPSAGCAHEAQDIQYLWASFKVDAEKGLSVDGWLNVVDEAASLGLNFIVFTLEGPLSENPGIWRVCHWAQDTYGITVGIHADAQTITPQDIEAFKRLDQSKARLYVLREHLDLVRPLIQEGVHIGAADPRGEGRANPQPCCDLPNRMIFVDQGGMMYTCKYVEHNDAFRLGHVSEQLFQQIVGDPTLPRTVPGDVPYVSHGCDGCPPILRDEDMPV